MLDWKEAPLGLLAMITLAACSGSPDGGSTAEAAATPAARFCGSLTSQIAACADPGECAEALTEDCDSFASIANQGFLEAGAECIRSNERFDVCIGSAIADAEVTDAHRAFATSFCAECAFGAPGCEEQFFGGSGEVAIAGNLVLPFGAETVEALRTECATGFGCAASFTSCAQRVLVTRGMPDRSLGCLLNQLASGGASDSFGSCAGTFGGADGGTAPPPHDATTGEGEMRGEDAGAPAEDAGAGPTADAGGSTCAATERCGDGIDDDCDGVADDGCGYGLGELVHRLHTYGGGFFSGGPFTLACSADDVVVGLGGRSGARVDQVAPRCAALRADGAHGDGVPIGSAGGDGGIRFEVACPSEHDVVVGLHGRSGDGIDALGVICADVRDWAFGTASSFDLASRGGTGGSAFRAACPRGYVLTELRGRAGDRVDELTGTCRNVVR